MPKQTKSKKRSKKQASPWVRRAALKAAAEVAVEKNWQAQFDHLNRKFELLAERFEDLDRSHQSVMQRIDPMLPNLHEDNSGVLASKAGQLPEKGLGWRIQGSFESKKK